MSSSPVKPRLPGNFESMNRPLKKSRKNAIFGLSDLSNLNWHWRSDLRLSSALKPRLLGNFESINSHFKNLEKNTIFGLSDLSNLNWPRRSKVIRSPGF